MNIEAIAQELLDALDSGKTIRSIAEREPGFGWEEGYAVAAELLRLRRARGERPVGRKIGFTNRNIWAEYGATAPIWAHVYERTVQYAVDRRASVSLRGAVQPRLEPEIAFRLKGPVAPALDDPVKMLAAIEWFAPSFEIVDCHFTGWKFQPADSAADFSFHWRLIVGEPHEVPPGEAVALSRKLQECEVILRKNGEVADRGVGANALGHPALALAHLVAVLAHQPQFAPLAAGEVITTGTLTAAMPIRAGDTWSSEYRGLSAHGLRLDFTA